MQELFYDLPGVIYEYRINKDGSRKFSYVSDNCIDILGIAAEALQKESSLLRQIVFKDDLPAFDRSINFSHDNRTSWNWEGRIRFGNSIRWIETRSVAINGKENLRKGIIIDITDRKQIDQEQELRYQSLVENLPLGMGIHVGGKIVVANAYAHKLLHAGPNELIGRDVMDFVHPESKSMVLERMKRSMEGKVVPVAEEKFICVDGVEIDVETTVIPFIYQGKQAVQLIVRDITQEKRAEEDMKRNESYFLQLFNNIPIAVVRLDEYGKVELVNRGFTEMFGYTLKELKGNNLNDFIVPEEFQTEGIDINNVIASNKIIQLEVVRKCKSGRRVNIILYGMPVRLEDRVIGIYGVYVDISERKKMEEELKIRNAELDNFVYKVSHDLRSPLSSILGLVNLSKFPDNPDNPHEYLKIIGEKVAGLDLFISDVLSHSKNLKFEVSITPIDLKGILSQTISDLNYLQGASEVEFEIEADEAEFYSDRWRISEIFRNLVSNAIKYRKLDSAKSKVKISIKIADEGANIIFADSGIGIEPDNLHKVFDMFYRATEQSDGSGIGLYIVKNAVQKLNGNISVESKPDVGTTFKITLPGRALKK